MTTKTMTSQPSGLRAVLYVRISDDPEGLERGVDGKEADCRAFAEAQGFSVVEVFARCHRRRTRIVSREKMHMRKLRLVPAVALVALAVVVPSAGAAEGSSSDDAVKYTRAVACSETWPSDVPRPSGDNVNTSLRVASKADLPSCYEDGELVTVDNFGGSSSAGNSTDGENVIMSGVCVFSLSPPFKVTYGGGNQTVSATMTWLYCTGDAFPTNKFVCVSPYGGSGNCASALGTAQAQAFRGPYSPGTWTSSGTACAGQGAPPSYACEPKGPKHAVI